MNPDTKSHQKQLRSVLIWKNCKRKIILSLQHQVKVLERSVQIEIKEKIKYKATLALKWLSTGCKTVLTYAVLQKKAKRNE